MKNVGCVCLIFLILEKCLSDFLEFFCSFYLGFCKFVFNVVIYFNFVY